ncbi:MAG TPA: Rieske (2Fe-2S) protein [Candidatus Kapabacteria bacterium]|jgi:cytochrome b6-f complex iron-sulfur subunit|nr:Rieske (2Fe-2S) protein [Candidatus Kapabacteria bacterium]
MSRSTGTPQPAAPSTTAPERREFLHACMTMLAGVTIVGIVSPLLGGCEPTALPTPAPRTGDGGNTTPEGVAFDVSILDSDGKSVATDIKGPDGFPILIVRSSATSYTALSMRCTHEACAVERIVPVGGPILCRCHGSLFELDGRVRKGPAATPLTSYTTTFDASTRIVRVKVS